MQSSDDVFALYVAAIGTMFGAAAFVTVGAAATALSQLVL
jgi:hypothetical protein